MLDTFDVRVFEAEFRRPRRSHEQNLILRALRDRQEKLKVQIADR